MAMGKVVEMIGKRCGHLTVIRRSENVKSPSGSTFATWECLCDCGNIVIARGYCLRNGNTTSCGCKRKTSLSKLMSTHGESKTRLYGIWSGMKKRCNNPASSVYKHYGERGIKVCDEWESDYMAFRNWALENGYKEDLSIDRINVDGDYEPSNCRWANNLEQANNTRTNRYITYKGTTLTMAEWHRKLGITRGKWDWLMKRNDRNAQAVIAACAGEIATGGD
jgi:hypothetical protein